MPRDAAGNYTLPLPDVLGGELIESAWANQTLGDIQTALTNSLSRNGNGGMLAPLLFADGTVVNPSIAFNSQPNTGFYRPNTSDMRATVNGVDSARWIVGDYQLWDVPSQSWQSVATVNDPTAISIEKQSLSDGQQTVTFIQTLIAGSIYVNGPLVDSGRLDDGSDYTVDYNANSIFLTESYPTGTIITLITGDTSEEAPLNNFNEYATVADMLASPLTAGSSAFTQGFYTAGDGGGANYFILAAGITPTDGVTKLLMANNNIAGVQPQEGLITLQQMGAKTNFDETEDSAATLQAGILALQGTGITLVIDKPIYLTEPSFIDIGQLEIRFQHDALVTWENNSADVFWGVAAMLTPRGEVNDAAADITLVEIPKIGDMHLGIADVTGYVVGDHIWLDIAETGSELVDFGDTNVAPVCRRLVVVLDIDVPNNRLFIDYTFGFDFNTLVINASKPMTRVCDDVAIEGLRVLDISIADPVNAGTQTHFPNHVDAILALYTTHITVRDCRGTNLIGSVFVASGCADVDSDNMHTDLPRARGVDEGNAVLYYYTNRGRIDVATGRLAHFAVSVACSSFITVTAVQGANSNGSVLAYGFSEHDCRFIGCDGGNFASGAGPEFGFLNNNMTFIGGSSLNDPLRIDGGAVFERGRIRMTGGLKWTFINTHCGGEFVPFLAGVVELIDCDVGFITATADTRIGAVKSSTSFTMKDGRITDATPTTPNNITGFGSVDVAPVTTAADININDATKARATKTLCGANKVNFTDCLDIYAGDGLDGTSIAVPLVGVSGVLNRFLGAGIKADVVNGPTLSLVSFNNITLSTGAGAKNIQVTLTGCTMIPDDPTEASLAIAKPLDFTVDAGSYLGNPTYVTMLLVGNNFRTDATMTLNAPTNVVYDKVISTKNIYGGTITSDATLFVQEDF